MANLDNSSLGVLEYRHDSSSYKDIDAASRKVIGETIISHGETRLGNHGHFIGNPHKHRVSESTVSRPLKGKIKQYLKQVSTFTT